MNTGHFIMWEPPAYMQPHAGEHSELHSDAASRGAGSLSSSSPTALWQGGGAEVPPSRAGPEGFDLNISTSHSDIYGTYSAFRPNLQQQ